ncbi:MAG: hypothetical protein IID12_05940 [Candidatus Marinimicrobia bacterium]|nr:hypothetical protein [Candidatus Neomarinimicrobiota bacterium]
MRKFRSTKHLALWLTTALLIHASIAYAQDSQSQLAQKIMLENHLRLQAESALKQALHKERFFVSVIAEISFTPAQRREQVWESVKDDKETDIARMGLTRGKSDLSPFQRELMPPTPKFGPVLPGFPEISIQEDRPDSKTGETMPEIAAEADERVSDSESDKDAQMETLISYSIENITSAIPEIVRLDVTVMLEDGVRQSVLEMVRKVVEFATGIDPLRGDNLNVVTASFVKSRAIAQLAFEASKADTISTSMESDLALRIQELEKSQRDSESRSSLFVWGAIAGLILLLLLAYFIGSKKRRGERVLIPSNGNGEPQYIGTPAELIAAEEDSRAARESELSRKRAAALERDMHKSELKNTRQAIITLSVGRPDTATKILNDWMSSEGESPEEA